MDDRKIVGRWRGRLAHAIDEAVHASSGGTIVVLVHPDPHGGWSVFNEEASASFLATRQEPNQ